MMEISRTVFFLSFFGLGFITGKITSDWLKALKEGKRKRLKNKDKKICEYSGIIDVAVEFLERNGSFKEAKHLSAARTNTDIRFPT